MKLLIRNLSRSTSQDALKAMFASFGGVQSCILVKDKETGASKGFGFVEMPKPGDAKAAMKSLNGKEVDGNKIRVKRAEDKSDENDGSEAEEGPALSPEAKSTAKPVTKTKSASSRKPVPKPEFVKPAAHSKAQPKTKTDLKVKGASKPSSKSASKPVSKPKPKD